MQQVQASTLHIQEPLSLNGSAPVIKVIGTDIEEKREVEVHGFITYIGALTFLRTVARRIKAGQTVQYSGMILL